MKTLLLFFGLIFLAGCSSQGHLVKQQWTEVETDYFRVITDASPDKVEALARELEWFRVSVAKLLRVSLADEEKLTIIALKGNFSYEAMVGKESARKTAGYFADTLYGRYALLDLNGYGHLKSYSDNWSRQLLYHEYTHYLVARGTRYFTYPFWFEEGFAEYLATAECDESGTCQYGGIPIDRALSLKHYGHLSLETLLTATRADSTKIQKLKVYASGWLLTHMLISSTERWQQLGRYLDAVHAGGDRLEAYEAIFGARLAELDKQYKQYARGEMAIFSLPMEKRSAEVSVRSRSLDSATAMAELGRILALKGEQHALQQLHRYVVKEGIDSRPLEYSMAFAALQSSRPDGPAVQEVLAGVSGADLFASGFDQAYATEASDDYWPRLVHAEALVRQAQQPVQQSVRHVLEQQEQQEQQDTRAELLRQAYYHYKSIVERDPSVAAAWFGLGHTAAHSSVPATTYYRYFKEAYDLSPQSEPAALALLQSLQQAQMRDEFIHYGKLITPMLTDSEARKRLAAAVNAVETSSPHVLL